MSWGATAYTPIITYNEPPFGFSEQPNPTDFPTCNQNPWSTGQRVKRDIQDKLKDYENRRRLNIGDLDDYSNGYDIDYANAKQLRCAQVGYDGNGYIDKHYNDSMLDLPMIERFTDLLGSTVNLSNVLVVAVLLAALYYIKR